MKIEKISENKIKITLTIEELLERKITLKDIKKNRIKAQDLFMDLIEENNLHEDFINENTELFVEASSDNSNFFMITITKVDYLKALPNYNLLKKDVNKSNEVDEKTPGIPQEMLPTKMSVNTKNKENIKSKKTFVIKSCIYKFDDFNNLNVFCKKAIIDDLFIGNTSLYKSNNTYFIIFKNSTIKNPLFINTFRLLSEYCTSYYSSSLEKSLIHEKSTLILDKNAIEYLSEF